MPYKDPVKNKECMKRYRQTDKAKAYQKAYQKSEKYKFYMTEYRKSVKCKLSQKIYQKNKLKTDIKYKLTRNLRIRLHSAIKGNYKSGSAVRDLGCTIDQLKIYLESKFLPGMTWNNWTVNGWHIDHIIPLSSFDLTNKEQLLKAIHYTNLQPLWSEDNLRKSSKNVIRK